MSAAEGGRGLWAAALLAGCVVAAVAGSQVTTALAGVFYDDGIYLALARALREGEGYRLLYLPGSPAGVHYPFGYPLFLAALWTLAPAFPANVMVFKWANVALLAVAVVIAVRYVALRGGAPGWQAAIAIGLGAVSVPVIAVTTVLFAEPLFLVLLLAACRLADAARGYEGRRGWLLAAAAGLVAGAAALTRSIGVVAIGGVVLSLVLHGRWRQALLGGALGALVVAPWFAWSAIHSPGVEQVLVSNYGTNGQFMAQGGAAWWSPAGMLQFLAPLANAALPPWPAARWITALGALPVLAWGLGQLAGRLPALGWSLAAYLAIVAVWPYEPSRFVWAVLPLLAAAFALGARDLAVRFAARPVARAGVIVTVAVVGCSAAWYSASGHARGAATAAQRGISATMSGVVDWVKEATDSSAVIAVEDEALVWLYSGRRAVPSFLWRVRGRGGESFGPDSLRAFLDRAAATHLVLTGPRADAAADVDAILARFPGYLRLIHLSPGRVMAFAIARGG